MTLPQQTQQPIKRVNVALNQVDGNPAVEATCGSSLCFIRVGIVLNKDTRDLAIQTDWMEDVAERAAKFAASRLTNLKLSDEAIKRLQAQAVKEEPAAAPEPAEDLKQEDGLPQTPAMIEVKHDESQKEANK